MSPLVEWPDPHSNFDPEKFLFVFRCSWLGNRNSNSSHIFPEPTETRDKACTESIKSSDLSMYQVT